jgi:hypothetical protein
MGQELKWTVFNNAIVRGQTRLESKAIDMKQRQQETLLSHLNPSRLACSRFCAFMCRRYGTFATNHTHHTLRHRHEAKPACTTQFNAAAIKQRGDTTGELIYSLENHSPLSQRFRKSSEFSGWSMGTMWPAW